MVYNINMIKTLLFYIPVWLISLLVPRILIEIIDWSFNYTEITQFTDEASFVALCCIFSTLICILLKMFGLPKQS